MLDLVIRDGRIVDGTGRAAFEADVGVVDGRMKDTGRRPGRIVRS